MTFKNSDFVHLHVHSEYSQFDGLAPMSDLVLTARKMGFPAIALTDHGVIAGWIKFLKECTQTKDKKGNEIPYAPIKPILGSEMYLARKMDWKSKDYQPEGKKGNRHLNLWAKNYKGYQNLCALSEKSWMDGFYSNPRIDLELLSKHSEGLICGTACLSSFINANLLHDRYDKAKQGCIILKDIFGEDLFLEVMYHGITSEGLIIPDIYKLSKELDIPVVATNDVHYVRKEQGKSHEVLMCMSTSNCITNPNHLHFPYDEFYLKSADEMGLIFKDTPQVLYNTLAVKERIDSEDIVKNLFGGMRLPHIKIPSKYSVKGDFEGSFSYLKDLAWEGMQEKGWDKSEKHVERLKKELRDVRVAWENNGYNFAKYFLIEEDIMRYARENNILTGPGRGCLLGDVKIDMGRGINKKISEISEGDMVVSRNGLMNKVIKKHEYSVKNENMINIKCYYGDKEGVSLTSDHKILVEKRKRPEGWDLLSDKTKYRVKRYKEPVGDLEWVEAKDVAIGDWVFVPYEKYNEENNTHIQEERIDLNIYSNNIDLICDANNCYSRHLSPSNKKCIFKESKHDRFITIDKDFFYVLGKFVADGWISRRDKNYIAFAFNVKEVEQINRIKNYFKRYNYNLYENYSKTRNLCQLYIKSKFIYEFFRDMFSEYDFSSGTKYVPDMVINNTNTEDILSFLIGLYDGDGHLSKYKLSYTTVSEKLAYQIKYLNQKIKIPTSCSIYYRKDNREEFKNHKYSYILVSPKDIYIRKNKKFTYKYLDNGFLLKVRDVQSFKYTGSVYDLAMHDESNYLTTSFLVHNSGVASVLLHSLGIAYGLDPLEYNLIWERFLGFDDKFFIKESDFGFDSTGFESSNLLENNDLEEDREVEEDLGGVDRY